MLAEKVGKKLNTYSSDYVVFDLETTGMSNENDDVIEISAVKVLGGVVVDEFSTLVNPGRPIPYQASCVNNISDDMVADAPDFETAFEKFIEFIEDMVLVGHNIHRFDLPFLYRDAMKYWGQTLGNDYVDTLDMSKACLPHLAHRSLVDVAKHYNIVTEGAHRALNDCVMNQQVYEYLKNEMANPSEYVSNPKYCPLCNNLLKIRNGKFGEFWGCKGYPNCKYTEKCK